MKIFSLSILTLFSFAVSGQHSIFVTEKMNTLFTCKPGTVERKVISYSKTNSDSSYFVAIKNAANLEKNLFISATCSPNGDGVDDAIRLPENEGAVQKLMIFDAEGQMLFVSTTRELAWTGSASKSGIYVYYLEIKLKGGEKVIQKGNITLAK